MAHVHASTDLKIMKSRHFSPQCKQPTRCNNFRLLIFLLIYLNLLYMFQATNSPIFRSTFDCIYSLRTMD